MAMISPTSSKNSSASLAPGFRFHPTDEELVRYYLRRKVCGKPFRFDAISEIDIYKLEPWDLPGKSKLKSRDLEWYFFSILDKKYGNSSRTNRATERGYWKTTGKDRAVYHKSQVVGMKKTLVYHNGRAPRGERSNWVMHEYRLVEEELEKSGLLQDAFVLCRIFQKSGSGPKNGEQYGAPFIEEEWENDELEMVPKMEHPEEVEVGSDAYLEGHDLEQILGVDIQPVEAPLPLDFSGGNNGIFLEDSSDSTNDGQNLLVGVGDNNCLPEEPGRYNMDEMPIQYDADRGPVKHEYLQESSKSFEVDYLLDEPFLDSLGNIQFGDGAFLETNDLANPIGADALGFDEMLEEYLTFHDANVSFDPTKIMESEELEFAPEDLVKKDVDEGTQQAMMTSSDQLVGPNRNAASSSRDQKFASECQRPYLEQASRMLGSIPAPPAFASEFPKKDAALHLNSLSQSSSSVHVTAGVIQIGNFPVVGGNADWALAKHGGYNIVLSVNLFHGDNNSTNMESTISVLPGKSVAAVSRGWFYFLFLWVLVLSVSFKIGTLICSR